MRRRQLYSRNTLASSRRLISRSQSGRLSKNRLVVGASCVDSFIVQKRLILESSLQQQRIGNKGISLCFGFRAFEPVLECKSSPFFFMFLLQSPALPDQPNLIISSNFPASRSIINIVRPPLTANNNAFLIIFCLFTNSICHSNISTTHQLLSAYNLIQHRLVQ